MNTTKETNAMSRIEFRDQFNDFPFWLLIQENQEKVIRWGKQIALDPKLRHQNNLKHIASVIDVAIRTCLQLQSHIFFDTGVVLGAIGIHEHGEALLLRDYVYDDKMVNVQTDVDEYFAYMEAIEKMYPFDPETVQKLEELFLLQYATKSEKWSFFPEDVQEKLSIISVLLEIEAKIFDAIERYEYLFYTLETASVDNDNQHLIEQVMVNQIKYLDRYAKEICGFDKIWTEQKSKIAKEIIANIAK